MKKLTYEYICDKCLQKMDDYYTVTLINSRLPKGRQIKELCFTCSDRLKKFLEINEV